MIALYKKLRQFTKTLGLKEAASLLETALKEEKAADEKLTKVAVKAINVRAVEEKA